MHSESSMTTLTLTPMDRAEAAALAKRILGSYHSLNPHDPETYIANLVAVLTCYPLWAGERAAAVVKRTCKFPPSEAELYPALEDQIKLHRYAYRWERDAAHLVEGRALLEGPPRVKESYAELKARYGEDWGITDPDRKGRPSPFRTLDELRAEHGSEAINAIPDAPSSWRPLRGASE